MTTGAFEWSETYLEDGQRLAKGRAWVERFRPALAMALDDFLGVAAWPATERFRRRLVQRGIDLDLDELVSDMPRSWWERRPVVADRVVLTFQVLLELPQGEPLLDACVAIVKRAYALYTDEAVEDPVLGSNDPVLLAAARDDRRLLLCARELLSQHPPHPLGGGTNGTDPLDWTRNLNEAAMPIFKDVSTIEELLAAQEHTIRAEQARYGRRVDTPDGQQGPGRDRNRAASPGRVELFVVMPFGEPWSDATYAFIRRATDGLGAPRDSLHLYRADEIADPGQITRQIKDSIAGAHVVVADMTGTNPNVMWELGFADGLGKPLVILNQDPRSSPFDMVDRRQVPYNSAPTAADEENFLRHLVAALRVGLGDPPPSWVEQASR